MPNSTKGDRRLCDQKMIAGIGEHLASLPSLTVGTESMTPAEIVSLFEGRIAKMDASAKALAAYRAALKSELDERERTAKFASAFKRLVEGMFYASPAHLADFGLKPVARAALSVADKAAAVKQGKATREARHTLGKKQKEAIKGVITPETPPEPTA